MTRLSVSLFGTPDAQIAGDPLAVHHQKARALLFYLAATGQPHTRDQLAALLWGDSSDSNARHSLRSSLYQLRQALRASAAADLLASDGDLVRLRIAADDCDVLRFRRLLAQGTSPALAQAVGLRRGQLLQSFTVADAPSFDEWARFEQAGLDQAYLGALEQLADAAEARQAWSEAIGYVQRIVQLDPLSEEAQRRLIELHLRAGAVGLALRQYHELETVLRHELGVAPGSATQALLREILRQDTPATRPAARRQAALPFVGRDGLLAELLALEQAAHRGQGIAVLIQGEGGIGKSRALNELIERLPARQPAWMVLQGSCSPFDDLLAYGPFFEAFQNSAAGDLTDLLGQSSEAAAVAGGPRFFPVLRALRTLAGHAPVLLAIEDLHWASSSTLNLFGFLALRLRDLPVMLIGTAQQAESIPALRRLITLGRRRGELCLRSLAPLSIEDVTGLLRRAAIGADSVAPLAGWLHDRSGGSPFILGEMLAQLRSDGILALAGAGWRLDACRWPHWRATFTLPETTHDLVAWRLANLPPDARSLLDVLAVAGQPLPLGLLRALPGIQAERLLPAIDDLLARRLLVESAHETLALPHHLLREALTHRMSNLRRRAIHGQLAAALERCAALMDEFPLRRSRGTPWPARTSPERGATACAR